MAKGARCKVKRRWRAVKRVLIEEKKVRPDTEELSEKLKAVINGYRIDQVEPPNAFKEPKNPNAVFPQYKPQTIYDFRSGFNPHSGLEYTGAYRRKNQNRTEVIVENNNLPEDDEFESDSDSAMPIVINEKFDENDLIQAMESKFEIAGSNQYQQKQNQNQMEMEGDNLFQPTKQISQISNNNTRNNVRNPRQQQLKKITSF